MNLSGWDGGWAGGKVQFNLIPHSESNSDPDFDYQLWRDPNFDPDSRLSPQTFTVP